MVRKQQTRDAQRAAFEEGQRQAALVPALPLDLVLTDRITQEVVMHALTLLAHEAHTLEHKAAGEGSAS